MVSCIFKGLVVWFLDIKNKHFSYLWLIVLMVQSMRETLIYLSHLDHDDTEKQVTILLFGKM